MKKYTLAKDGETDRKEQNRSENAEETKPYVEGHLTHDKNKIKIIWERHGLFNSGSQGKKYE